MLCWWKTRLWIHGCRRDGSQANSLCRHQAIQNPRESPSPQMVTAKHVCRRFMNPENYVGCLGTGNVEKWSQTLHWAYASGIRSHRTLHFFQEDITSLSITSTFKYARRIVCKWHAQQIKQKSCVRSASSSLRTWRPVRREVPVCKIQWKTLKTDSHSVQAHGTHMIIAPGPCPAAQLGSDIV